MVMMLLLLLMMMMMMMQESLKSQLTPKSDCHKIDYYDDGKCIGALVVCDVTKPFIFLTNTNYRVEILLDTISLCYALLHVVIIFVAYTHCCSHCWSRPPSTLDPSNVHPWKGAATHRQGAAGRIQIQHADLLLGGIVVGTFQKLKDTREM